MDVQRATSYQPLAHPRLWLELANVKTTEDVLSFVAIYGLLHTSADPNAEPLRRRPTNDNREPVAVFLDEAQELRLIARTMILVKKADNGDAAALQALRAFFDDEVLSNDRDLLIHASDKAAWWVNDALLRQQAMPYVFDRAQQGEAIAPGRWRVGILPETLLGVCYLTLALSLADQDPLDVCPECERPFVVEDGRQRFCTPVCASRARFKRFNNRAKSANGRSRKRSRA